jgi:phospholipid/cholesterol/gamma-HCH transport system permease protein
LILPLTIANPMRTVGGFFAMALDTVVQMFKPPFAFREFLLQTWFIARACADYRAVDSVHRHGGPGL